MEFRFTEEQQMIGDSVKGVVDRAMDERPLPDALNGDVFDKGAWKSLGGELGLAGLIIPETYGGSGLGQVELCIVQEEIGARLVPVPFFTSAALATGAILACASDDQKKMWLPELASGALIASWAHDGGDVATLPALSADGKLSGKTGQVVFASTADLILVTCLNPKGERQIVAVQQDQKGMSRTARTSLDLTQPVEVIEFSNASISASQLLPGGAGEIDEALNRGRIALAADQLGGAQAALSLTTEYAKERVQFGRQIGSFQALKHIMADMMSDIEAARSAVYYAACAADELPGELGEAAALSLSVSSAAYQKVTSDMIQLHGGIGFTWEHIAHLYFKRAWTSSRMLGARQRHLEHLATELFARGAV